MGMELMIQEVTSTFSITRELKLLFPLGGILLPFQEVLLREPR